MNFEWDDNKARLNEAKHGVSFEMAARLFLAPDFIVVDASRQSDGEARLKGLGLLEGRLFTVVFTKRGEVFRLISARPSNAKEIKHYGDHSIQS